MEKIEKDTRQILMESAQKLMAVNGYHNTKVEEITKDAGVAKGTFYNYFQSKEEMYFEMVEEKQKEYSDIMGAVKNSREDIESGFKMTIKGYLTFALRNSEFFILTSKIVGAGDLDLNKKLKEKFHGGRKEIVENISEIIKYGIKKGKMSEKYKGREYDLGNIFETMMNSHIFFNIFKDGMECGSIFKEELENNISVKIDEEVEFIYNLFFSGIKA